MELDRREMAAVTATSDDIARHDRVEADSRRPLESLLLTPGVVAAVRSLVEIMERGGVTKLDLVHGDLSVRLRSNGGHRARAPIEADLPAVPTPADLAEARAPDLAASSEGYVITSPMVGTFYAAPSPGAPPFVQVGDRVEAGEVVGIVEAMKIMNEIAAERGGTVAAILVDSGQAVEYGSPLIRLA